MGVRRLAERDRVTQVIANRHSNIPQDGFDLGDVQPLSEVDVLRREVVSLRPILELLENLRPAVSLQEGSELASDEPARLQMLANAGSRAEWYLKRFAREYGTR